MENTENKVPSIIDQINDLIARGEIAKPAPVSLPAKTKKVKAPIPEGEGLAATGIKQPNIPNVPVNQWLAHVRAITSSGLLHVQTKPNAEFPSYYKYNVLASNSVCVAVDKEIAQGKPTRPSCYGSSTKYLICARISETEIDIPNVGKVVIPAMANAVPSPVAKLGTLAELAGVDIEEDSSDFEDF